MNHKIFVLALPNIFMQSLFVVGAHNDHVELDTEQFSYGVASLQLYLNQTAFRR
jgi:hypothetical protein